MSVTTRFRFHAEYNNILSLDKVTPSKDQFIDDQSASLSFGTGPGQINKAFKDHQLAVASGGTVLYPLSVLAGGQAMTSVLQYYIRVVSGTGTIGPAPSSGWTAGMGGNIPLFPGTIFPFSSPNTPIPVTSGSNDTIQVSCSTGPMEYYFMIVGQG